MDDAYFTIRWKRLIGTLVVVGIAVVVLSGILKHQRAGLTDRLLDTARQLAEDSKPTAARVAYLDYLELHPQDAAARVELIEHVMQTEPADGVRDAFVVSQATKALYGPDRLPEVRLILVDAAMRLKWYSTVAQWLPSIQDLADQHPRLTAFDGICLFKKGNFHDAENQFRAALLKDPACRTAWLGLIDLTELKKGAAAAIDVADDWVSQSLCAESYLRKAQLLVQNGTPLEAVALYQDARLPEVDDVEGVRDLAGFFVYEFPSDIEADSAVLQRIYRLLDESISEPTYDDLVCLGDLAHRSRDIENAQRHYQQCLENRPGDLFATGRQVELFVRQGLNKQAHETLDGLTDSDSQKLLKTTLIARLLAQESKHATAVVALESVINLHSEANVKQDAYGLLVECLWQQQRFSEAAVHAKELLAQTPTSPMARRFCAEAFIRSGEYSEAIKCVHGFVGEPEEQINAAWRMLAHAEESGLTQELTEAIDRAALTNHEATVPVVYKALKAVDLQQTGQAVLNLKQAMVDHPGQAAFRIAVQAVEERALRRMTESGVADVVELKDAVDQRIFLQNMLPNDPEHVGRQLKNLLKKYPDRSDVVELTHRVLNLTAEDQVAQRAILVQVYPELSEVIQKQGNDVVPKIARLLASCGYHSQAFQFLTDALQSSESVLLIETFCGLMSEAADESDFHVSNVMQQLDGKNLSLSETAEQVLRAECEIQSGNAKGAMGRLLPLVQGDDVSNAALFVILTHIDEWESVDLPMTSPDLTLKKVAPDNAAVLLACSRWNRRQNQYLKAASLARDSYLHDDRTEVLIELASIEWRGNYTNRASHVLELAYELQFQVDDLQPLHRKMLDEMRADARMQTPSLSQHYGRSSGISKPL